MGFFVSGFPILVLTSLAKKLPFLQTETFPEFRMFALDRSQSG